MPTFLKGKFAWARILAEKKGVRLVIQDNPFTSAETRGDIEESLPDGLLLPHDIYLHVDTHKIDQVIRNLITNAV